MNNCDVSINNTIVLTKNILNIIQIVGPIICMIALAVLFAKIVRYPNDKKLTGKIKNIIIALVVLFFIPMGINTLMYYLGDKYNFTSCWNNSNEFIKSSSNYLKTDSDKSKNSISNKPNNYEKGVAKGNSDIASTAVQVAPYASPDNTTVYGPKNYHEDSVASKCGSYYTPNPWYPPSQVDPKYSEYEKLMDSVINDAHPGNKAYGSCAQAAGGIIRATVDPDFETGNPTLQLDYLSKSSKWQLVKVLQPGDNLDSNCLPGDLLVTKTGWEHTMIYVGNEAVKKKFPTSNGNIFQAGYDECDHAKYPRIDYIESTPVPFNVYRVVK